MPTHATKGVETSRRIEPELLKIPEICKMMKLDRRRVEALMDSRAIRWIQVGGQKRTSRSEVLSFLYPGVKIGVDRNPEINLKISDMAQILNLDRRSVQILVDENAITTSKFGKLESQRRTSRKILIQYINDCLNGKTKSNFIICPPSLETIKNLAA